MKNVLIVIDMQNDFISGALGSEQAQAIVPKVADKIAEYEGFGGMVFYTRDTHDENYLNTQEGQRLPVKHCIEGTWGWEIVDELQPYDYDEGDEAVSLLSKSTFGTFDLGSVLDDEAFEGLEEIELVGVCTDICVITNALLLKTKFPEVTLTVDAACCAGVTEESHKAALLTMKMCQVNVINEEA